MGGKRDERKFCLGLATQNKFFLANLLPGMNWAPTPPPHSSQLNVSTFSLKNHFVSKIIVLGLWKSPFVFTKWPIKAQ